MTIAFEPRFRSDIVVRAIDWMGDDKSIIEDARTSVRKPGKPIAATDNRSLTESEDARIGDFLMHRHASVLRGCVLKVEVEAPIFVQRQLRTHWVGFSQLWANGENDWLGFNDQSGKFARYRPDFWIPYEVRFEQEQFDPMNPAFVSRNDGEDMSAIEIMRHGYMSAWNHYSTLIENGVAREIARSILPEGTYVAGRITANLNGWLGLMSLRIDHHQNAVATYPQLEIQMFAESVEEIVKSIWPVAHRWWSASGRVRP